MLNDRHHGWLIIVLFVLQDNHPSHDFGFDFEMSEEDQMMRAIALSLGQDVTPMAVDQVIYPFVPSQCHYPTLWNLILIFLEFSHPQQQQQHPVPQPLPESQIKQNQSLLKMKNRYPKKCWITSRMECLLDVKDS